jgi:hypothetical protein
MKIELSDYFVNQGFRSAYLFENNMGRNCVELIHRERKPDGGVRKRFISYAKFLWISHNNKEVPTGYEVDHINGNGKDDRIENLQLLSKRDNIIKEKVENNMLGYLVVDLKCPICGGKFTKRYADIRNSAKSQPCCCSRSCSGLLSHSNIKYNRDSYLKECADKAYKQVRLLLG